MTVRERIPAKSTVDQVLNHNVQELPAFPVVAMRILDLIRDDRSSAGDIAKLVESDPAITAKVLRIVNSAAYGFRSRISSVTQAIVFLGLSTVRTLVLGMSLYENIIKPSGKVIFDRIFFWKHCLSVAGLCMALAEYTRYPRPEEAYVAGLLHDIGKIILDGYGRISYGDFLQTAGRCPGMIVEEERRVIGLGHDDLGAYFCADWGLPRSLQLAISLHHQRFGDLELSQEERLLTAIVALANFITWTQGLGSADMLRHPPLQPEIEGIIDLGRLDFQLLLRRMDLEVKKTADLYSFTFPSAEQFRSSLLKANLELARINTRHLYQANLPDDADTKGLPSGAPADVMARILEILSTDFGYDHLILMKIDAARRSLVPVKRLDKTGRIKLAGDFAVKLVPQAGGLITCMRTHSPMILTGKTPVERQMIDALKCREVGVIPFANSGNKIIGVLGVSNCEAGRSLKKADLISASHVANELGRILEALFSKDAAGQRDHIDGLTRMPNRRYLENHMATDFAAAVQAGQPFSLVWFDLDRFKQFNEQFGHLDGDSVLKLIAGILRKHSRPGDVIARFGGNDFMSVLGGSTPEQAAVYGRRMHQEIQKLGKLLARRFPGFFLTMSIGIASLEHSVRNHADLLQRAGAALAAAKSKGGDCIATMTGDDAIIFPRE